MNKNFFRQYNKLILGSIILFFTALLFNHWTPYAADDYSYMFNLSDGSRMTSIGQIFSSLAVHYTKYGNGRLISHFFVMLFLIGSKWIFNLVNAFIFVLLILSIYHLTSHKKACSLLLFFAIPTLLWLYMPAYGQIFLWLDGSINYMWSYLFALLFLSVYITLLRGKSLLNQTWKLILFCIYIPFWKLLRECIFFRYLYRFSSSVHYNVRTEKFPKIIHLCSSDCMRCSWISDLTVKSFRKCQVLRKSIAFAAF